MYIMIDFDKHTGTYHQQLAIPARVVDRFVLYLKLIRFWDQP